MSKITYRIVPHDGGWAYRAGDTFSETFPTHDAALAAARTVAFEQTQAIGHAAIEYEDASGRWHREHADDDPPEVDVEE